MDRHTDRQAGRLKRKSQPMVINYIGYYFYLDSWTAGQRRRRSGGVVVEVVNL